VAFLDFLPQGPAYLEGEKFAGIGDSVGAVTTFAGASWESPLSTGMGTGAGVSKNMLRSQQLVSTMKSLYFQSFISPKPLYACGC
jgi:hypothetical protein